MTRSPKRPADPGIAAAAQMLSVGDAVGALRHVALRDDAPALALRGIALAQVGDFGRSRELLKAAAAAYDDDPIAHARCIAAEAEVALASRDLGLDLDAVSNAAATLLAGADHLNAVYAELVVVRALVLNGRIDNAQSKLQRLSFDVAPPMLVAVRHLLMAEVAIRRIEAQTAAAALESAHTAARASGIGALVAEVENVQALLQRPAARVVDRQSDATLTLGEVETLLASEAVVVDGCRRELRCGATVVSLVRRATSFKLFETLAMAGPEGVDREELISTVFGGRSADESHRARLRVDTSRLRKVVAPFATISATPNGFAVSANDARPIVVLRPPIDGDHATVLALLADGQPWSTSALATATATSQRTVQRALGTLLDEGRVTTFGEGPARRWMSSPLTSVATVLLLPIVSTEG